MGKKRCFLGFLVSLFVVFFTANVFAAGYMCTKQYSSCKANYFLVSDATNSYYTKCQACPANSTSAGDGNRNTRCQCKDGYSADGKARNTSNMSTTSTPCLLISDVTVTLAKNGGSGTCGGQAGTTNGSFTCTPTQSAALPAWNSSTCNITKTNHIFKGWSASSTATIGSTGTFTCPTDNKTYYAAWQTCAACTKGAGVASCSMNVVNNECEYTAECKDGYRTPRCTSEGMCSCTANTNTITLNKNGGSGTCGGQAGTTNGSFTCRTNSSSTLPAWNSSTCNITKTDHIFKGWSIYSTATSGSTGTFTCPTDNKTYYAAWQTCAACTKGTGVASCSKSVSNNACTYTATCKTGYNSPTCDANGHCICTLGGYHIYYYPNGGTFPNYNSATNYSKMQPVTYGSNVTLKAPSSSDLNFSRNDYTAVAWKVQNAQAYYQLTETFEYNIPGNLKLDAMWCKDNLVINNGTKTIRTQDPAIVTSNSLTCNYTIICQPGYHKSGEDCVGNTYTVTFNANGGSGQMSSQSFTAGQSQKLSKNLFVHDTLKFVGWSRDKSATEAEFTDQATITAPLTTTAGGTVTLYAIWADFECGYICKRYEWPIVGCYFVKKGNSCEMHYECDIGYVENDSRTGCEVGKFVIALDKNDGESVLDGIQEIYGSEWLDRNNQSIESIKMPSRMKYEVRGYYASPLPDLDFTGNTGKEQIIPLSGLLPAPTIFTKNTTIYAAWAKHCAVVANGSCTLNVAENGAVTYITTCNSDYHHKSGKNTAEPVCERNTYRVKYNCTDPDPTVTPCDGEMDDSLFTGAGKHTIAENQFTRTGKKLLGWTTHSDGSYDLQTIIVPDGEIDIQAGNNDDSITLYTVWEDCESCADIMLPEMTTCSMSASKGVCNYNITCQKGYTPNNEAKSCEVNKYKVTYVADNGTDSVVVDEVPYGDIFTTRPSDTFTYDGYTFGGWGAPYPESGHKYPYNYLNDTTLHARWCQNCADVSNGSCSLRVDEHAGISDNEAAKICTYTTTCNSDGYKSVDGDTPNPTCEPKQFIITYRPGDGGIGDDKVQYVYYQDYFTTYAAAPFSKPNATFAGWRDDDGNTLNANAPYPYEATNDTTLTATWKCNAGYTLNNETQACDPCGAGTAKGIVDNGECPICAPGTYSTGTANTSCTTCPAGMYCTGGTHHENCPAGTSRSATGGQKLADCSICGNSTYSEAGATGCTSCTLGYFNEGEDAEDHANISSCQTVIILDKNGADGLIQDTAGKDNAIKVCQQGVPCDFGNNANLVLTGYKFQNGWGKSANCSATDAKTFTDPTGTYYACKAGIGYTIKYDANKPDGASGTVSGLPANTSCTYGSTCTLSTATPTLTNWTFSGWALTKTGSVTTTANNATTTDGATVTVYAQWTQNAENCQSGKYYNGSAHVDCPAGKYCPGTGSVSVGSTGCATDCPSDPEDSNATISSDSTKDRSLASSCTSTRKNIAVVGGSANKTCYWNGGQYEASCTITVTSCDAGYYRLANSATICSQVGKGQFSPAGDIDAHECSDLRADGDTRTVTTDGVGEGTAATKCYAVCDEKAQTDAHGNPSGKIAESKQAYTGTTTKYPACPTTPTECYAGYTNTGTTCAPKVLEISLNHSTSSITGTSTVNTIYLKYNDGWYSNANATTSITKVPVPETGNSTIAFSGYRLINDDGTLGAPITDATGTMLTTSEALGSTIKNSTAQAEYGGRDTIMCDAGYYYPGTGDKGNCQSCTMGNYCPGGSTGYKDSGISAGIFSCSALLRGFEGATSAAGAKSNEDCYVEGLEYHPDYTYGTQTCFYNQSNQSFSRLCKDKKVTGCDAGYYYQQDFANEQCAKVGVGHYSPAGSPERYDCPDLAKGDVTTQDSASGSIQNCYRTGLWHEDHKTMHGGERRRCYHVPEGSSDTGYTYNCKVGTIVACDAGYYLADNNDTQCTLVDDNHFSPAQSAFYPSEPLQPTTEQPGSSIYAKECPFEKTLTIGDLTVGEAKRVLKTPEDRAVCEYNDVTCDAGYSKIIGAEPACRISDPGWCPEDYYCPGDTPIKCPYPGKTDGNAKEITKCYIIVNPDKAWKNGSGSAQCFYDEGDGAYSKCNGRVATCDAGYRYNNPGTRECFMVDHKYYSPEGDIDQTPCPQGADGSQDFAFQITQCYKKCDKKLDDVENAVKLSVTNRDNIAFFVENGNKYEDCQYTVECETGYEPQNNGTENPACTPKKYKVTLDKMGGTGDIPDYVECTFDAACTLPATYGLTRAGYTAGTKWCTKSDGTGTCFDAGQSIRSNISSDGSDITLFATWNPQVYKITLKHDDSTDTGLRDTAYLKYTDTWYADPDATIPLVSLTKLPTKTGYTFGGYNYNDKSIVNAGGTFGTDYETLTFTTQNANITAVWGQGNTHCDAGSYYSGTGATCLPCNDNHYCPGGDYPTDNGKDGELACPDGGKTVANARASSVEQCFKSGLNTYVAAHGTGTQTCYYNDAARGYINADTCFDRVITACERGYWHESVAALDCSEVGRGYYSPADDLTRSQCPNGGTTLEGVTTASTINSCYKSGLDYSASYGTGTKGCYYTTGEGNEAIYNTECNNQKITACRGGYWLDVTKTALDCSPVGTNYFSNDNDLHRQPCPNNGKTNTDTEATIASCYITSAQYTADHGGGYQTCYYDDESGYYKTGCLTPTFEYCTGGYYYNATKDTEDCVEVGYGAWSPDAVVTSSTEVKTASLRRNQCDAGETTEDPTSISAAACHTCPAGMVCDPDSPDVPKTCSELTGGQYPNSAPGTTNKMECWRDCALTDNAATMKGHDYYGIASTCDVEHCKTGYNYNAAKKTCEPCPAGMFCGGGDEDCPDGHNCGTQSCADLGDGGWPYSDKGATTPESCYRKCESYTLTGGTAYPINDREFYDKVCEFEGFDNVGNPCTIEGDVCVPRSCKPSYEMINGKCVACNRQHALSYKETGNCMVEACEPGWHPFGQQCENDIEECDATNALRAEAQWDYAKNTYGICMIKECESGFHISSNACVADVQSCTVEHGIGEREWNHKTNKWGDCVATSCDPGWTSDPYDSNEPTKPCGRCKNYFGINGEPAVSGYSRDCTISACMYQGELYNLEGNECVPICDVNGYTDETGSMIWDADKHKCIRTCRPGYVMW